MNAAFLAVLLGTVGVNLPFGYWREGTRKFSAAWFVAIHAPVPLVILLRRAGEVGLAWSTVPFLLAAYFVGQAVGARIRRVRGREREQGASRS